VERGGEGRLIESKKEEERQTSAKTNVKGLRSEIGEHNVGGRKTKNTIWESRRCQPGPGIKEKGRKNEHRKFEKRRKGVSRSLRLGGEKQRTFKRKDKDGQQGELTETGRFGSMARKRRKGQRFENSNVGKGEKFMGEDSLKRAAARPGDLGEIKRKFLGTGLKTKKGGKRCKGAGNQVQ